MPVETGTYISDLVSTNPLHTDGLGQADSHIRLIKAVIQATFPNINAAVTATPANLNNGYVPIGGIIRWSGAISAIPTNWQLCDGTNGTPDLRGKFVIGADKDAGGTYNVGSTGGALSVTGNTATDGGHGHTTTSSDGSHSHTGNTLGTALTAAQIPPHSHNVTVNTSAATASATGPGGQSLIPPTATLYTTDNGNGLGGQAHTHPLAADGAHTHSVTSGTDSNHAHSVTVATVPPYYALAYIRRMT